MDRELIGRYLASKPNIRFAFLFGSRARGDERENSDNDIAICVEKWDDVLEYLDWKQELEEICWCQVDLAVLNDAPPLLKYQVYLDGVLLFCKDDREVSDFLIRALFEYEDFKPYLQLSYNTMIERIKREVAEGGKN